LDATGATGATGLATGSAGGAFASEAGAVLRFLLAGGASICYQSMLSLIQQVAHAKQGVEINPS